MAFTQLKFETAVIFQSCLQLPRKTRHCIFPEKKFGCMRKIRRVARSLQKKQNKLYRELRRGLYQLSILALHKYQRLLFARSKIQNQVHSYLYRSTLGLDYTLQSHMTENECFRQGNDNSRLRTIHGLFRF